MKCGKSVFYHKDLYECKRNGKYNYVRKKLLITNKEIYLIVENLNEFVKKRKRYYLRLRLKSNSELINHNLKIEKRFNLFVKKEFYDKNHSNIHKGQIFKIKFNCLRLKNGNFFILSKYSHCITFL